MPLEVGTDDDVEILGLSDTVQCISAQLVYLESGSLTCYVHNVAFLWVKSHAPALCP